MLDISHHINFIAKVPENQNRMREEGSCFSRHYMLYMHISGKFKALWYEV